MEIEELGYLAEMRQRLGLKESDKRKDAEILALSPFERVRLIAGWEHGSGEWANIFKEYCESQGLFLTINPNADGIIKDE